MNPGPNYCWHIDGYDKLKPYGFPIHACIDGFSRKVLWLKVVRSNNNPVVVAKSYLEVVRENGGCPTKVRSDCGTENGLLAATQCFFMNDLESHIYGTSPHNQRIEAWWSFYRRSRATWWINFFKDLMERSVFTPGNDLEMECLWFCFSNLIQHDLDTVKDHWNTHFIRRSRHETVSDQTICSFCLNCILLKTISTLLLRNNASIFWRTTLAWRSAAMSMKSILSMLLTRQI